MNISSDSFLIDGQQISRDELINMFKNKQLSRRCHVALEMLNDFSDPEVIVDLGSLYGLLGKELKKRYPNAKIICGDYLADHCNIAKALHPSISEIFQQLNAYSIDLEDSSVDALFFLEVIEHLEGAAQAVKEINRVLKTGGRLILSTPTAYYWKDMLQLFKYEIIRSIKRKKIPLSSAIYFEEHEWNRHIYCWTPSTLYTLLKVNGFKYVSHKYCQDGKSWMEKVLLKFFPFLSPTINIIVEKEQEAQKKLI